MLPTYTNTWFAVQYGLTLYFGLLAVHVYQRSGGQGARLALSYVAWLAAGMTHGTGALLGPALALVAGLRDRRWHFAALLFLGTTLVLWVQHLVSRGVAHNLQRFDSPLSLDSLKFMARVVTPPMWETALFALVVAPLLLLTAWLYFQTPPELRGKALFRTDTVGPGWDPGPDIWRAGGARHRYR